jgi:hypothetical protein
MRGHIHGAPISESRRLRPGTVRSNVWDRTDA